MQPKQKNWVFLACMLIVALFSVVVVFRNVKYMGRYAGQRASTTNLQELMVEVDSARKMLDSNMESGGVNRPEVYAKATKIAALLEELIKEAPENPTADRIGDWDGKISKAVQAANRLADIAGDPGTEWSLAAPAHRTLIKACDDCHQQFREE